MAYTQTQWENARLDAHLEGGEEEAQRPIISRSDYNGMWKHRDTGRFLSNEQALAVARKMDSGVDYAVIQEIREDIATDARSRETIQNFFKGAK